MLDKGKLFAPKEVRWAWISPDAGKYSVKICQACHKSKALRALPVRLGGYAFYFAQISQYKYNIDTDKIYFLKRPVTCIQLPPVDRPRE